MIYIDETSAARLAATSLFLLDMDGTFYLGNQLLDGSLAFLDALYRTGRRALFLTNNSSKSSGEYVSKLARMGVPERHRLVFTSGQATAMYCAKAFPGKKAYALAMPAVAEEMMSLGVAIDNDHPDYIIITFDQTLTYAKLCLLCDLVQSGIPYIATHPDRTCPTETGSIPDIGALMVYVESAVGRLPDAIIGKPNAGIVAEALSLMNATATHTAMVGDRLYTDIPTGVNNGLLSVMVLTGEATMDDLAAVSIKPHIVAERLASMIGVLEAHPL